MALVAAGGDRFLDGSSATGPVSSEYRLAIAGALGSLLLHGVVSLGFGLLHGASAPLAAPAEIPIEVVIETALPAKQEPSRSPKPVQSNASAMLDVGKAPPGGVGSTAPQSASPQGAATRARRPSSFGLGQEPIRAVDRGDEPMRYDVAVLGQLERAKQFPKRAALWRARDGDRRLCPRRDRAGAGGVCPALERRPGSRPRKLGCHPPCGAVSRAAAGGAAPVRGRYRVRHGRLRSRMRLALAHPRTIVRAIRDAPASPELSRARPDEQNADRHVCASERPEGWPSG
jgi:hypothetical protein